MAAGGNREQITIPFKRESPKAAKKESKITDPLTFPEFILFGFTAVGGYYIVSFLFQEAVKYLKQLGQ